MQTRMRGAEMTQRDTFFNIICSKMATDKDIYIVTADMGCPALDEIKRLYPKRVINTGIAEQNMINIASGLALEGKRVYTYIITSFYLRCLEQIRVNVCGMKLPIVLVGVGAGFGYEDSGFTHHAIEDVLCTAYLPHMTVYNATDNNMTKWLAEESVKWSTPSYIRLDRETLPTVYQATEGYGNGTPFNELGFEVLRTGDKYIVATGNMVHEALKQVDVGVIDCFSFPTGMNNITKHYSIDQIYSLAEDNIFNPMQFKDGYNYQYGGREKIRRAYNIG